MLASVVQGPSSAASQYRHPSALLLFHDPILLHNMAPCSCSIAPPTAELYNSLPWLLPLSGTVSLLLFYRGLFSLGGVLVLMRCCSRLE